MHEPASRVDAAVGLVAKVLVLSVAIVSAPRAHLGHTHQLLPAQQRSFAQEPRTPLVCSYPLEPRILELHAAELHTALDDAQVAEREQAAPPHALDGLEPLARPLHRLDGVAEAFGLVQGGSLIRATLAGICVYKRYNSRIWLDDEGV